MVQIDVTEKGDNTFSVTCNGEEFSVTARPAYLADVFGGSPPPPADAVRASFAFLLDREPQSQIMKSFDLSVIETYFPEYREEIGSYLREN